MMHSQYVLLNNDGWIQRTLAGFFFSWHLESGVDTNNLLPCAKRSLSESAFLLYELYPLSSALG